MNIDPIVNQLSLTPKQTAELRADIELGVKLFQQTMSDKAELGIRLLSEANIIFLIVLIGWDASIVPCVLNFKTVDEKEYWQIINDN